MARSGEPYESRSSWTLQQHCDHANAQLILKDINPDRQRMGLPPVHWVIRNGRVVCELLSPGSKPAGQDAKQAWGDSPRAGSAPENTAIPTP
jgi:hypothetical protein